MMLWPNDVYESVRNGKEGYYEDLGALLCGLTMSRHYWVPITALFADGFESGDTSIWSGASPWNFDRFGRRTSERRKGARCLAALLCPRWFQ